MFRKHAVQWKKYVCMNVNGIEPKWSPNRQHFSFLRSPFHPSLFSCSLVMPQSHRTFDVHSWLACFCHILAIRNLKPRQKWILHIRTPRLATPHTTIKFKQNNTEHSNHNRHKLSAFLFNGLFLSLFLFVFAFLSLFLFLSLFSALQSCCAAFLSDGVLLPIWLAHCSTESRLRNKWRKWDWAKKKPQIVAWAKTSA